MAITQGMRGVARRIISAVSSVFMTKMGLDSGVAMLATLGSFSDSFWDWSREKPR